MKDGFMAVEDQRAINDTSLAAESFHALIRELGNTRPNSARCFAMAKTKLEECVMWIEKGIVG